MVTSGNGEVPEGSRDGLFRRFAELVAGDPELMIDGWRELVLAGRVRDGSAGMSGFAYLDDGDVEPVSPGDFEILDVLTQLRDVMAEHDPDRRRWLAALFRIDRATGRVTADYEYVDADRWAVTPATLGQRVEEFRPGQTGSGGPSS